MGDRGNVYVVQHPHGKKHRCGLYLYTHWYGTALPYIVQSALKVGRTRWDDEQYLARIIFEEMILTSQQALARQRAPKSISARKALDRLRREQRTLGFGLSNHMGDNEHDLIVVDCRRQTIGFAKPSKEPKTHTVWSFEKFIKLSEAALHKAWTTTEDEED